MLAATETYRAVEVFLRCGRQLGRASSRLDARKLHSKLLRTAPVRLHLVATRARKDSRGNGATPLRRETAVRNVAQRGGWHWPAALAAAPGAHAAAGIEAYHEEEGAKKGDRHALQLQVA